MFAIHSRQCSTLFSYSLDSMFLLGCNSITSFVLWQLALCFQCFPEMYRQGVLGQLKFTCSNSNQIPGECVSYCIRPSFKEISCVVMKHLKQGAFFLFSEQLRVEAQMRVVVQFQMIKLYQSVHIYMLLLCIPLYKMPRHCAAHWLEGIAHRIVGEACELWQRCGCHSGVKNPTRVRGLI